LWLREWRIDVKQAFWTLFLVSLAHAAPCPTGQRKDEAALVQIEQRWARAVEQHDPAVLDCILAHDFEEARFNGQLSDRSEMLTSAAQHQQVQYELSELHAHVYGDFGYIRGTGVALKNGGTDVVKTRFTDIFVYRDGRWQCVAGHESLFPATAH
jgi:ketosteroid isomerase-like protein